MDLISNINKQSRIYVAGHKGMVGSAIVRYLKSHGYQSIITRTHAELDLTDQQAVREFYRQEKIDFIFIAAAKVGGILANFSYPADFIYQNLMIELNLIHEAFQAGIGRLLFLGSSCIYPKFAPQPMKEEYLLTGPLEPTNEPYAIAKIAGIKLCEAYNRQYGTKYRSVMPTNLFGPYDNFHPDNSHVIPGLIMKFHQGKMNRSSCVEIWGTGSPKREFLYVDDLASACVFVMEMKDDIYENLLPSGVSFVNVGTGKDMTIRQLAEMIKEIVGFEGEIIYDTSKPDGTPQKLLDISLMNQMGWKASTPIKDGLKKTYEWFLQNYSTIISGNYRYSG